MQGPNPLLSEAYGTASVQAEPSFDDSSVDAFVKVAMEQGWDLDQMDQTQVYDLYEKVAEAMEESTGEAGDQIEAAADDLAQAIKAEVQAPEGGGGGVPAESDKQASLSAEEEEFVKTAEQCDFMGRIIAHAQWDELKKLAEAEEGEPSSQEEKDKEKEEGESEKEAAGKAEAIKELLKRIGGGASGAARAAGGAAKAVGKDFVSATKAVGGKAKEVGKQLGKNVASTARHPLGAAGLGALGGASAGMIAGSRMGKSKKSEDEAFQELVLQKINEKLAFAEYDDLAEQIADRTIAKLAEEAE